MEMLRAQNLFIFGGCRLVSASRKNKTKKALREANTHTLVVLQEITCKQHSVTLEQCQSPDEPVLVRRDLVLLELACLLPFSFCVELANATGKWSFALTLPIQFMGRLVLSSLVSHAFFFLSYITSLVALTQTTKKTRDHKASVIKQVREAIDSHNDLYLFSYENMRSSKFKIVRSYFQDSRIFLGKNKLLQIALGKTEEDEYGDNLRQVAELTTGSVGLLLTSRPRDEVESYFRSLVEEDFCRAGAVAPCRVVITQAMVGHIPCPWWNSFVNWDCLWR
jgi:ribosomal protein L10